MANNTVRTNAGGGGGGGTGTSPLSEGLEKSTRIVTASIQTQWWNGATAPAASLGPVPDIQHASAGNLVGLYARNTEYTSSKGETPLKLVSGRYNQSIASKSTDNGKAIVYAIYCPALFVGFIIYANTSITTGARSPYYMQRFRWADPLSTGSGKNLSPDTWDSMGWTLDDVQLSICSQGPLAQSAAMATSWNTVWAQNKTGASCDIVIFGVMGVSASSSLSGVATAIAIQVEEIDIKTTWTANATVRLVSLLGDQADPSSGFLAYGFQSVWGTLRGVYTSSAVIPMSRPTTSLSIGVYIFVAQTPTSPGYWFYSNDTSPSIIPGLWLIHARLTWEWATKALTVQREVYDLYSQLKNALPNGSTGISGHFSVCLERKEDAILFLNPINGTPYVRGAHMSAPDSSKWYPQTISPVADSTALGRVLASITEPTYWAFYSAGTTDGSCLRLPYGEADLSPSILYTCTPNNDTRAWIFPAGRPILNTKVPGVQVDPVALFDSATKHFRPIWNAEGWLGPYSQEIIRTPTARPKGSNYCFPGYHYFIARSLFDSGYGSKQFVARVWGTPWSLHDISAIEVSMFWNETAYGESSIHRPYWVFPFRFDVASGEKYEGTRKVLPTAIFLEITPMGGLSSASAYITFCWRAGGAEIWLVGSGNSGAQKWSLSSTQAMVPGILSDFALVNETHPAWVSPLIRIPNLTAPLIEIN